MMFEIGMFGFLPKWASNGVVFALELGINLMFSILLTSLLLRVVFDQIFFVEKC